MGKSVSLGVALARIVVVLGLLTVGFCLVDRGTQNLAEEFEGVQRAEEKTAFRHESTVWFIVFVSLGIIVVVSVPKGGFKCK